MRLIYLLGCFHVRSQLEAVTTICMQNSINDDEFFLADRPTWNQRFMSAAVERPVSPSVERPVSPALP